MKIEKSQNGSALVIALAGRLDTTTAPELDREANASLAGATELTIDLAALDYISSAGLRVLLSLQKTMNKQGAMIVKNACETVREVFDITGFSSIMTLR